MHDDFGYRFQRESAVDPFVHRSYGRVVEAAQGYLLFAASPLCNSPDLVMLETESIRVQRVILGVKFLNHPLGAPSLSPPNATTPHNETTVIVRFKSELRGILHHAR